MNLRNKKGSISIFVLVALLFMSAFLILLFARNVNKSKVVQEQFNIITGIYAYGGGDEGAYDKAYTDLRKKNKRTFSFKNEADAEKTIFENTSTVELTKTFDEEMSNYRIYGNSVQDTTNGDPTPDNPVEIQSVGTINLFNINGYNAELYADDCLAFDISNLVEGERYTFSSNKPISWLKISNRPSGYNSVQRSYFTNKFINYTFIMTKHEKISETEKQYMFIGIGDSVEDGFVKDISQLDGYNIQIQKGEIATPYGIYGKYNIPVKVSGKNLVNIPDMNVKIEDYYYKNYFPDNPKLLLEPKTTYTVSFNYLIKSTTANIKCGIGYGTNVYAVDLVYGVEYPNQTQGKFEHTFTTPAEFNSSQIPYLQFRFARTESIANVDVDISNIQVELSDKATEYLPYQEEQSFNIYLDEPLRKVGDVADYIDFSTGKVVRKIKTWTLTDEMNFSKYGDLDLTYAYYADSPFGEEWYKRGVISNTFIRTGSSIYDKEGFNHGDSSNRIYIRILKNRVESEDEEIFEKWVSDRYLYGTPIEFVYELQTQEEEIIKLPELKSYEDYTKIEVLTEVAPSKIEVEYQGYTLD